MADILQRIEIQASPEDVYRAIVTSEGLSGWWTVGSKAEPKIGSIANFPFGDAVTQMRIDELKPSKWVGWTCVAGPDEWVGTKLSFDLEKGGQGTIVRFSQIGWPQASDFYRHCNTKWSYFLHSLKAYVETGTGTPYPADTKI